MDTFKGIEKRNSGLSEIFAELKENKKKPKYNYHSGLCAGLLLRDFSHLQLLVEAKDIPQNILETIIGEAKTLIESYNWKKVDLYNLLSQVFNEDE